MGWIMASLLLFFAVVASAQPIRIGMLDAPLDYESPLVSGNVDRAMLETLRAYDDEGRPESWWERNGRVRGSSPPPWSHGMTVASILLNGVAESRLVNFANFMMDDRPRPTIRLRDLWSRAWREGPAVARPDYIATGFREAGVRVVNFSFIVSDLTAVRAAFRDASYPAWLFGAHLLHRRAIETSENDIAYYLALIQANPQAVFVLAAGNDGRDLGTFRTVLPRLRAPNLIVVGATDEENRLTSYSNYNPELVDVAALGNVELCGRYVRGTSCAAPQVANRLVRLLEREPQLTAAQAIQRLLREETVVVPSLRGRVHRGRMLRYPCVSRLARVP